MSHSPLINYPYWESQYTEALFEDDPGKLRNRISIAESALLNRLSAILQDPNASVERCKIENALENLRELVRLSGIQAA